MTICSMHKAVYLVQKPVFYYPEVAPFHPTAQYPEYIFESGPEPNPVYEAVRQVFYLAGLDLEHYNTQAWNPLKGLIHPGETVLLKPNLVKQNHPRDSTGWR